MDRPQEAALNVFLVLDGATTNCSHSSSVCLLSLFADQVDLGTLACPPLVMSSLFLFFCLDLCFPLSPQVFIFWVCSSLMMPSIAELLSKPNPLPREFFLFPLFLSEKTFVPALLVPLCRFCLRPIVWITLPRGFSIVLGYVFAK